jgi:hypothetical protein
MPAYLSHVPRSLEDILELAPPSTYLLGRLCDYKVLSNVHIKLSSSSSPSFLSGEWYRPALLSPNCLRSSSMDIYSKEILRASVSGLSTLSLEIELFDFFTSLISKNLVSNPYNVFS